LLAIFAGVLSNFVAETMGYGPVAPFALACIPLMICGGIVTTSWPENFGDRKLHFRASLHQGLREIIHDRKVRQHLYIMYGHRGGGSKNGTFPLF
jgi:hypothetical protein